MIQSSDGTWTEMGTGLPVSTDIFCDNFKQCDGYRTGTGNWVKDEQRARVGGWHIFHGFSETGKRLDVYLCPTCVGTSRSRVLPPGPEYLDGQLSLLEGGEG